MSFCLDTNIVLSLIFVDDLSERAHAWISGVSEPVFISDWLEAEFFALVNRRVRSGVYAAADAKTGFNDFDSFRRERAHHLPLSPAAGARAALLTRNSALKLSAADALHLGCASEGGHCLTTCDERLALAARTCGYEFVKP